MLNYHLSDIDTYIKGLSRSKDTAQFVCPVCKQCFLRTKRQLQIARKNQYKILLCSVGCGRIANRNRDTHPCHHCGKIVSRTPSKIEKRIFCSHSCAATFNNKCAVKRTKEGRCTVCKISISKSLKHCKCCWANKQVNEDTEIGDLFTGSKYNKYMRIRQYARIHYCKKFDTICQNCDYKKQIDVAHVVPIAKFDKQAKLGVVNNYDNLVGLCKRCHWELDNDFLLVTDIDRAKHQLSV